MNNNNISKNFGAPPPFKLTAPQSMSMNHQPFSGHFQLQPQGQFGQPNQPQQQVRSQLQPQMSNATNAGVFSPPVSTPGTASAKRIHRPSPKPSGISNTSTPSMFKTMELTPAARRKKRKLPENSVPDKVAAIIPESALYTQLLEFEARVDSALKRYKVDIQDTLKNPPHVQKTLRLYVFNTFANQSEATPETKSSEEPSWSLRIIGRILEDGKDPVVSGSILKPGLSCPKFSSFIKKITIYLDQNLYPDNHVVLWENARSPAALEGFEVKRKGSKEFTAIIRIEMNHVPERFKLSPALKEVLGTETDTRSRVLSAIWQYVKAKKLQSPNDPSFFFCDPQLQKVFGEDKMKFTTAAHKIMQHLTPPQPIHLEHRINLSGSNPSGNTCYDVLVDMPFPLEKEMNAFLENTETHKDIDAYDELIRVSIKKLHEHHRRRAFFLAFSQSPARFINFLIESQSKDLNAAAGDANRIAEKEQLSEFYNQPWVEDAVIQYLNRKHAESDAP